MSKILQKSVKKLSILSALLGLILAAAIAVSILFGVKGWGVFNTAAPLNNSKTLTVSMSQITYQTKLDEVEEVCEDLLGSNTIRYDYKYESEMSGDSSEVVYVFAESTNMDKLNGVKDDLQAKFDTADWEGAFVTVSVNSEVVFGSIAEGYVLRGVIAGVVLSVLVFIYVAIRYGWRMGVVSVINTALGMLLTTALFILTRIPVTASVIYVIAIGGLLTAVMTLLSLNKIREAQKEASEEPRGAEELVCGALATKEIALFTVLAGVAIVLMGGVTSVTLTLGVMWFALLSMIALLVAACLGLVYAPALYIPFKKALDKKPVKGAYMGAEKTSTKIKKFFEKKKVEDVEAAPVAEEATEETPVEESEDREEAAEEPVEEAVEESEVTEEVAMEPSVEETEAPAEETVEETKDDQD